MNSKVPLEDTQEALGRVWRFSECEFDELRRELRVKGNAVELEAKPLEVLRQLLLRAGEVVTKEELLESVWPGLMVVDGSLATAVSKLRKGLGDDDQIVRTVPRIGYRLAVPVKSRTMATPAAEPELLPTAPVPGREQGPLTGRFWMLVVGVALLIVLAIGLGLYRRASSPKPSRGATRITSLAVLPLANMSGDPAQDYFADGMTEELITDLSKIRALKVISRTSVMQYKGAKKPLAADRPGIARGRHPGRGGISIREPGSGHGPVDPRGNG